MEFNNDNFIPPSARIKVIGIGGGGGNAVNTMIRSKIEGVDFIAANTDVQSLRFSLAGTKIQIGTDLTKGLGAGADPDIGRDAALEDRAAIQESLEGSNMVFVTAGMGGGTGTGGASIVAQIARDIGALTVGVVTKPFAFEGKRRQRIAEIGISRLKEHVDTLITIPNQRLLQVANADLSMMDAFKMADNVLVNAVRGISNIINVPGFINVDFADVKTIMSSTGLALMGIGTAEGPDRAMEAAHQAISSPLLEDVDIEGATGILINITAGTNISLAEVDKACRVVQEAAHEDANIIFGAVFDETMGEQVRVTVIATGFPSEEMEVPEILSRMNTKPRYNGPLSKNPGSSSFNSELHSYSSKKDGQASRQAVSSNFDYNRRESVRNPVNHSPVSQPFDTRNQPGLHQDFDPRELTQLTLGKVNSFQPNAATTDPNTSTLSNNSPDRSQTFTALDVTTEQFGQSRVIGAQAIDRFSPVSPSDNQSIVAMESETQALYSDGEIDDPVVHCEPVEQCAINDNNWQASENHGLPRENIPDMEAKIDAALEMVDRINTAGVIPEMEKDNLDIPAFLRNGLKDLSLS